MSLESHLREVRSSGRKSLVPYVTAGIRDDWLDMVSSIALAGADAIEIQIPFSDPAMDGPTVQAASTQALSRGMTPAIALRELADLRLDIPIAVMTYYNLVYRFGHERFAEALNESRVSAVVLPDLPFEESGDWRKAAGVSGIETVGLVAPNTPDERLKMLCDAAEGFVYVVSTLGVTGERSTLSESAAVLSGRVKAVTDKPAIVGFGISNAAQAAEAASTADGVIVASAVMRRAIDGQSVDEIAGFIAELRAGIDGL